jgi:pimeloyl-ACP methyl ester carboxylesterase
VGDLGCVLDALERWGVESIGYAGHSMGGAVGVLRAASDPRITCLVSLAGMVHVDAFFQRHFAHLPPGAPMLGKPECPWSPALADDAARIGSVTEQAAGTPTSSYRIRMRAMRLRRQAGGQSS